MITIPDQGVVRTPRSKHWVDDGILFSICDEMSYLDFAEAKAITAAFIQLSTKPLPLFVDLNTASGQSSEARKYFASDPDHVATYSAVALFVSNPVAKVIANVYMGLVKPKKPTRLFTDIEEALAWLEQFKETRSS